MESREILLYLALKYEGNWNMMYQAIYDKEQPDDETIIKRVKKFEEPYITLLDENFPEHLKRICKPPFVLFYKGDISLLQKFDDSISVVGSRAFSKYGERMTSTIVRKISKKLVIVSGLAKGIDAIAHRSALNANGKTIAVIGCGLENFYPKENEELFEEIKQKGLVITEYPSHVSANQKHFPVRNRLIAGLSRYLLIPEAKMYSGTSITATLCLQFGGDIMCVPTRAGENSLCNHLISSGAFLVESADDVFFTMNKTPYCPVFKSE